MKVLMPEKMTLTAGVVGKESVVLDEKHALSEAPTRVRVLRLDSGEFVRPHYHEHRLEIVTVIRSAGAQIQIGDRIFRPVAGQCFQRGPKEVMAITNDSSHAFELCIVSLGYDEEDIVWQEPAKSQVEY